MIAVDTNILVHAHRRDAEFHRAAAREVRELAQGRASWAIPWPCIHEFFAITTHPKIYDPPSGTTQAIGQIEAWLASPTLVLLGEPPNYWPELKELLIGGKVRGPMVHDARIAALCLAHGVRELWSADRDFGRFGTIRIRNPLVTA
jgi:toxin-antitoxin system PIN domain toxin